MYQLEGLLKSQCDPKLSGVMSMTIKHASKAFNEFISGNPVLKENDFRNSYGYLRHSFVDYSMKWAVREGLIDGDILSGTSSNYSNGHTYLSLKVKGAVISPVKTRGPKAIPRKALYRQKLGLMNQQISLFDDPNDPLNSQVDINAPAFLLLTYGGRDYGLDYIELGLPDVDTGKWIGQVSILHAPMVISSAEQTKAADKLDLSLTSMSKKLLEDGKNGEYSV